MNDNTKIDYLQAALNEALSYYGLETGALVRNYADGNFTAEIRASVEIPRSMVELDSQKALQGILKVLEYRIGTSGYTKELTAGKDEEIRDLEHKVDRLERMLESALDLRATVERER